MAIDTLQAATEVSAPATKGVVLNLAADVDLSNGYLMKGLFVGTGGDIVGRGPGDTSNITFKNVQGGTILPFRFISIASTLGGTTAADLIALF